MLHDSIYQLPGSIGPLWLERFSPYFADESFPIRNKRPRRAYQFIYPEGSVDLDRIAYFFDYNNAAGVSDSARSALNDAVDAWRARWQPGQPMPSLRYQRGPGWIGILDRRSEVPRECIYDGWRAFAYEACGRSFRTAAALRRELSARFDAPPSAAELTEFLDACVNDTTMIEERSRYLSLAMPITTDVGARALP